MATGRGRVPRRGGERPPSAGVETSNPGDPGAQRGQAPRANRARTGTRHPRQVASGITLLPRRITAEPRRGLIAGWRKVDPARRPLERVGDVRLRGATLSTSAGASSGGAARSIAWVPAALTVP